MNAVKRNALLRLFALYTFYIEHNEGDKATNALQAFIATRAFFHDKPLIVSG